MKISTKGRYALRVMADLAKNRREDFISIQEIATRQGISVKYLESIIAILCKAGFVVSRRGKQGGYKLSKSPKDYTIGSILKLAEGSLAPVSCLDGVDCAHAESCDTLPFWQGLNRAIDMYVESYTLQDLVSGKFTKKLSRFS